MSSSTTTFLAVLVVPILTALLFGPPKCIMAQLCTSSADLCWDCSSIGNYTAGSAYETNLKRLLSSNISYPQNDVNSFFRNASSGQIPNEVNAIGLCRADVDASRCLSCLKTISIKVLHSCPRKKEAILWAKLCMVRYSNRSIFSLKLDEPLVVVPNPKDATDKTQFEAALRPLLAGLIKNASSSVGRFASGNTTVRNGDPVHAVVQCTPDLSPSDCGACLKNSTLNIPEGKIGGRVLKPSCTLKFESGEPIYKSTDSFSTPGTKCSQNSDFCWSCYGLAEETNSNSVYMRNLNNLISSVTSKDEQNGYGFYNVSTDGVSVIAMCRGDLDPDDCQRCVRNSSQRLISEADHCPNRKKAIAWDEHCMVRYSNESIFSTRQDEPIKRASNPEKAVQQDSLRLALDPLLINLTRKASLGDSRRKYASGKTPVDGYDGIYAFAQCTPDLGQQECSDCLQDSMSSIQDCCQGVQGVKLLKPSCVWRYEVTEFFGPTVDLTDSNSTTPGEGIKRSRIRDIIIGVVVSVIVAMLICIFIFLRLRNTNTHLKLPSYYDEITGAESLQYDLETLKAATEDFSEENKLGRGGFGHVYRGKLPNGQLIAVKRLSKTSDQGDKEFKNEVSLVAKLQHRNLVRLLGFCLDDKETLLIYEFVPNSSLDKYIFDPTKRALLDWDKRYKIIRGIARGLLYIHEDSRLKIVHCDLKGGNVLLDEEMNPKISDFGMARLFALDETQGNTKKAAGTYGYMAPEYAIQGHFSVKSDVFSFGVLLLEIISGQKNGSFHHEEEDQGHLLTYAWKYWTNGTASNLLDPLMLVGSGTDEIMKCIHIGLLCVQENVADRPTMELVVHMLNSRSHDTLTVPAKPGFFMGSSAIQQPNDANQVSVDDATITEIHPRA